MSEHVYKIIELAGSSQTSVEDAVARAIGKAGASLKHMRWFEVTQTRGMVEHGKITHWQVVLKVGFTLEDDASV